MSHNPITVHWMATTEIVSQFALQGESLCTKLHTIIQVWFPLVDHWEPFYSRDRYSGVYSNSHVYFSKSKLSFQPIYLFRRKNYWDATQFLLSHWNDSWMALFSWRMYRWLNSYEMHHWDSNGELVFLAHTSYIHSETSCFISGLVYIYCVSSGEVATVVQYILALGQIQYIFARQTPLSEDHHGSPQ